MRTLRAMLLLMLLPLLLVVTVSQEVKEDPTPAFAKVKALSPSATLIYNEIFDDNWEQRWVISEHPDFQGEWKVDSGPEPYGVKEDYGLFVNSVAKRHAIVSKFNNLLDNTNKDLIVQYELRLSKELDCGGAYIKLLTASTLPKDLTTFSNEVPYTIMFGPDKCGATNKVHFILRHKNPVNNVYEEKHLKTTPSIKTDSKTHLYRLKIDKENGYEVSIDNSIVASGSLLEDFEPSINPPEEIDDPEDKKPLDWVDEATIADPDATKPDDWDEDAPPTIVDEDDTKPDGWLDDEPSTVPDPDVEKPADWDDALDGDWEAPAVPNPKCTVGCGEWKPRIIPNPAYKGKWNPPMIPNPAYKGEWKARQIPNPNYFVDEHPHNLEPIGAIGIELWTMKDGIIFDNILITHSEAEAEQFTSETWEKKHSHEEALSSNAGSFSSIGAAVYDYVVDPQNLLVVVGTLLVASLVPVLICCFMDNKKSTHNNNDKEVTTRRTMLKKLEEEKDEEKRNENEQEEQEEEEKEKEVEKGKEKQSASKVQKGGKKKKYL